MPGFLPPAPGLALAMAAFSGAPGTEVPSDFLQEVAQPPVLDPGLAAQPEQLYGEDTLAYLAPRGVGAMTTVPQGVLPGVLSGSPPALVSPGGPRPRW